jgi:hypothetical protein
VARPACVWHRCLELRVRWHRRLGIWCSGGGVDGSRSGVIAVEIGGW